MSSSAPSPHTRTWPRSPSLLLLGMVGALLLLILCLLASMSWGAADIPLAEVWNGLFAFDGDNTNHLIIRTVRLPRSLTALLVGSALAMAGAIVQGLTLNPLGSPSILGINAGAAFAVVVSTFLIGASSASVYASVALIGGSVTAGLVYGFAAIAPGGANPLNLTLAGTVFSTLVSTFTSAILIANQQTLEQVRFWLAGSLGGSDLDLIAQVLPYLAAGFALALTLGKQMTALSLSEGVARGLGQNTALVKVLGALAVVLLVGGSVSIAGPIGFLGLIVPHFARFLVGVDYRWILPYAAILGAMVLLAADLGARLVLRPVELPVGLVMPLLGGPLFVYLVRTRIRR